MVLIAQRMLLPGIVIVGCFIFVVLNLTALIETSIQLFGPNGGVNGNCNLYVLSMPFTGVSIDTLAYLEQKNICKSPQQVSHLTWKVAMLITAIQVKVGKRCLLSRLWRWCSIYG